MKQFDVEEEYILEPGDMLYLPPHVGHHGVSLSDDCMTYSFGYRSYPGQELWDSLGEYLSEHEVETGLYRDPNWSTLSATSELTAQALLNAKDCMQQMLNDEQYMKRWFGCFATRLDQHAEQDMPEPLTDEEAGDCFEFIEELKNTEGLERDPTCRMAYQLSELQLFINGCEWCIEDVSPELVQYVANHRVLGINQLRPFLDEDANQQFLFGLWRLQWLNF